MSRPNLLSEEEIATHLEDIPTWVRNDKQIEKEIVTSNFAAAVGLVNSIAVFAEKQDHHPDILLYGWNKVKVTLSTHDQGGLTKLDFELAKNIDSIKIS